MGRCESKQLILHLPFLLRPSCLTSAPWVPWESCLIFPFRFETTGPSCSSLMFLFCLEGRAQRREHSQLSPHVKLVGLSILFLLGYPLKGFCQCIFHHFKIALTSCCSVSELCSVAKCWFGTIYFLICLWHDFLKDFEISASVFQMRKPEHRAVISFWTSGSSVAEPKARPRSLVSWLSAGRFV